jgi:S-DNA-T family DNA segregation ATPase FtsK/SpoIIIE
MRIALTVVSPAARQRADIVIEADPTTTIEQIAVELDRLAFSGFASASGETHVLRFPNPAIYGNLAARTDPGIASEPVPAYIEFQRLDPRLTLKDSPIRDGAVLSLGSPDGCVRPEPTGIAEIRVAGGPGAGAVHRVNLGDADIGSGSVAIRVSDDSLPPYALRIRVEPRGNVQVAPFPEVAATLDREPLTGPTEWHTGQQITVGSTLLQLAPYEPPDAALHPSEDGAGIDFNRPPRLLPPPRITKFSLPKPPEKQQRRPLPILMAVAPLAMGAMLYFLTKQVYTLAMCGLSPIMAFGNWLSSRKEGRVSYATKLTQYNERKAAIEREAKDALEAERIQKRDDCPDPATVLSIASGPRRRLWERRRTDPDYLVLRAGTADQPSAVELTDPTQEEHRMKVFWDIPDAPVTIPLAQRGVLGVAGPQDAPRALGRWIVAQAAVLHSPNDLQIWVLTDSTGQRSWDWTRWLPHCRGGDNATALIGNSADTTSTRITELLAIINERHQAGDGNRPVIFTPDIMVVFDGSRKLRSLPGAIQILREGPRVGVYSICLDADERLLPAESQAVAVLEPNGLLRVQQMNARTTGGVRPDYVSPGWSERVGRGLAAVRDASDEESTVELPTSSRLLDVLRLEPPTAEMIARRWQAGGISTVAVIGESYDGPFGIDLKRDGPHGLIAGTTGAGKSELLQTFVASLAAANRPDAMNFVLIDYKGGSAFKDCARLPHTVGMVSDLDGHLTQRALASLSAELKRREEILLHAGAKDIEDYNDTRRLRPDLGLGPLPRLVLIIDEFASLVAELPDFVTGLVGIAQRGRSLGVHLILATQRPAGVVSADIRANTNLRIALRVTDPSESQDVIDVPDAAWISKSVPGRCFVRSGASGPVGVQSARIGGRRPGTVTRERVTVTVSAAGWSDLGRPLPQTRAAEATDDGTMQTDLALLVDAIADAARLSRFGPQRSPWLAPLPEIITLNDVPPVPSRGDGEVSPAPFGIMDVPARQGREPMALDLAHGGHLVVAGAARTGRSTVLRTIAGAIAARDSAADVHLYGIDCGAGALLPLTALPHCGAVVTRDQTDRIERLLAKLRGEIGRRQQILAMDGFAGLAEQRARATDPSQRLPWIVLMLDWWEGYFAAYEKYDYGKLIDSFLQILREGSTVGLRAVVTTDRQAMLGQTGTVFERRMVLRLNDPGDATLAGIPERLMPVSQPPGRIMIEGQPDPLEVQVALLDQDPSGPAQVAALRQIGSAVRPVAGRLRPMRVDALPSRITLEETLRLDPSFTPPSPVWAMTGAGGDELTPVGLDLVEDGPGLTIAGPARSGRSTTLMTMALSLLSRGTPVLAITPRRSPLRSLAGRPGMLGVLGSDVTPDAVTSAIGGRDRYVVILDDAELLVGGPMSKPLEEILASGRDAEHGLIIASTVGDLSKAFGGFAKETLKSRAGVLVAISSVNDGDIFGIRLPRNASSAGVGRGLLVKPGTVAPIQLAVPE